MTEEIILTKEECDWILSLSGDFTRGGVTHDGKSIEITNYRTCYEYTLENHQELSNLILNKIKKFNVKSLPSELTIVRYEPGQYFKVHIDSGYGHEYRYRTVSIQLSDETEYNGGDLMVWLKTIDDVQFAVCASRKIGNVVIFDSSLKHEAEEILSGTRYALVFWLKKEDFV